MFTISWQLTLLAFISVPAITVLSKSYGHYIRSLTKLMQKKLADGNSVSEAALSAMPTVRAFGAENAELFEFSTHCERYLVLNRKSAIAYLGYATITTLLPQIMIAVVLFYGGLLVHSDGPDHISSGQLGETFVLNRRILLLSARLFNMLCFFHTTEMLLKKSTRLSPESVIDTLSVLGVSRCFFGGALLSKSGYPHRTLTINFLSIIFSHLSLVSIKPE